ncbi:ribosome small subunit-dependent GTPase A [Nocardia puris]|uniref:Small ribosomal subunit biogenesis GTPase RsgA n=1 Tax=Nocardia puris TaxID=208602 RepID=A0A366DP24_9NOCA|nr:ribosome small subunit-dependent GTPase A [Nocardia puris]MBF6214306.1 ribosome small subunit-dependent GTPase A [Nocardia puris]MBF6365204.1 ribosome small subunit-dependent GTPase A [Nocardia puris]MBF6459606.1 ribosome small subunit-dependent GTPase A [Nocardia puris]RBO91850.1 ribosome biogenesis GTPase [Nocardia puris]
MVDYDLLVPYGWTEAVANQYAPHLDEGCVPARVVRMDRSECDVVTPDGPARATCPRPDAEPSGLCTGDWVGVDARLTVRAVLPRRSAIVRSTASRRSEGQVLAANVDTVLICTAADGDVDLGRIERMLALAWESGAQPVVVLTKADAAQDIPLDEVRAIAPGATVLAVSATGGHGLDVLAAVLDGTVALIGPSGAGKSTLANALLGADVFATNAVRSVDKKGRHTTVHRELRPLPGGGTLIDTPGLRGIGLWDAADGIEKTFSDIESLAAACRFHDCAHNGEPGCAVRAAIESGALTERRLESYRKLARENEWMRARTDKRLQAEREQVWKDIAKHQRRMYRERGGRR